MTTAGLFGLLKKALAERMLQAEFSHHLEQQRSGSEPTEVDPISRTPLFLQKESEVSKPHTQKPLYPAQFREQMIELVRAGRKPGELTKEFGCHATSILNWVRQADASSGVAPGGNVSTPI